ncbi:MAG: DUF3667 domain-containing protein, partial [Bacteroidota bacterium]
MENYLVDDAEKRCLNCGSKMAPKAKYCAECGQKYTTGRIKLRTLLAEFFETVFNIDNKTLRTLGALFIPGKLTQEFFKGRHETYFRPIRIFLIMAILHIAAISFVVGNAAEEELEKVVNDQLEEAFRLKYVHEIDSLKPGLIAHYNEEGRSIALAVDSLKRYFAEDLSDSTNYSVPNMNIEEVSITMSKEDYFTMPVSEIPEHYGIQDWVSKFTLKQTIRINRNLDKIVSFAVGNLTWMLLLMMPALALILKLLYIRRGHYYVEHLIFSFHYHAFAFLIMSPAYLFSETYPSLSAIGAGVPQTGARR